MDTTEPTTAPERTDWLRQEEVSALAPVGGDEAMSTVEERWEALFVAAGRAAARTDSPNLAPLVGAARALAREVMEEAFWAANEKRSDREALRNRIAKLGAMKP